MQSHQMTNKKGLYKYDVYLVEENKAHFNLPNKDRIAILV